MKRKNPTSPIRTGFDYQDIWGLYLCAEWMSNPKKYQWIWFETIPEEATGHDFYLDDIVLCGQNNLYCLYQIKHKQNPNKDKWSWDEFLKQDKSPKGKLKNSLIQKWFNSYFKNGLIGKIEHASFVTNGFPKEELKPFIIDDKIDIYKVKAKLPNIYAKIKAQLIDEDKINSFFSNFKFSFGQKNVDDFGNEVRETFYKELKATKDGVTNLLQEIRKQCRQRYTKKLSLEQIKQWYDFDNPRPLNESFRIPKDFEFFDKSLHKKIFANLRDPKGGLAVIFGKPGTGKSTYLSKLYNILTENKTACIRHHFHISPNDPNPLDRLSSHRVIEAIKAQFKEYDEELGNLAHQNSQNIPLQKYIDQIAQHFSEQNKSFILIIDGLDHVLRHGDKKELNDFLKNICFPQPGLWIIFGMQEVAKDYLPQIVFDMCPSGEWIEIKGLNEDALSRIISNNIISLHLPDNKDQISELDKGLFEITQGNPLHLRYTLQQLKNNLGNRLLTVFDCNDLLPYADDIAQYYDSLWRKLHELGKTIALIIASISFRFKREQLFNLLASVENNPTKISEGYKSIAHLLLEERRKLSVYHNSFQTFILEQPEFQQQEKSIKTKVKEWLENADYEDLKWAELRKLAYDLGNPKPILKIGRDWLIDALCFPRESRQIISQLELGAEAAFKNNCLGKTFELSSLDTYYQNALEFVEEEREKIWEEALKAENIAILDIDLRSYSSKQLQTVIEVAEEKGHSEIIDEVIEILNDRHKNLSFRSKREIGGEIPQLPSHVINIVALDRQHEVRRIHRYIKQFEESGWTEDLFAIYTDRLLKTAQFLKIEELLKSKLAIEERQKILTRCAEYDLEFKTKHFLEIISKQEHESLGYFCLLYLLLNGKQINFIPQLPTYDYFPSTVPEYESGKREERAKIFSENFILGIIYRLTEKGSDIQNWIKGIERRWTLEIMSKIFKAALDIGEHINNEEIIPFATIFMNIESIKPLRWPEDRDLYELQICFYRALSTVLKIVYFLKGRKQQYVDLDDNEMKQIISGEYFNRENFLQFLLSLGTPLLTRKAFEQYICEEKDIWEKFVTNFTERAGHYADLSKLASIHQDDANHNEFLRLAASNLLGYGYHKDMYLDGVLQSIEICHRAGSKKTGGWIRRIASIVENVTEYTDGDETNYFPRDLAGVLVNVNPKSLYKYYYQNAGNERLFLAQDIFKYVVRSLPFAKDTNTALATTALDEDSLKELKLISNDRRGAKQALDIIEDHYCPNVVIEKRYNSKKINII